MEIVSRESGIAVMTLVADEVAPPNGYHLPALLNAVAQRYRFAEVPSSEMVKKGGAKFFEGVMTTDKRPIFVKELHVYNDGLGVVTKDTTDSEAVMLDVAGWLQNEFAFRPPQTPPLIAYRSEMVVRFDTDISDAFERRFAPLIDFLHANNKRPTHKSPVKFQRIALATDPTPPGFNSEFVVERRAGQPWDSALYYSAASLTSSAHAEALELYDQQMRSFTTSASAFVPHS
jgi:hypothetical protein